MVKVVKLLLVVGEDVADMLAELAELSPKERESRSDEFTYEDKHGVSHEMHYVLSETV